MEPAKIDWKTIDSTFVEDVFYEHIRAPKWFDFLAPDHSYDAADAVWFCRPDCKHPKTVEDFLITSPASKPPRSGDADEILQPRNQKQRDTKLKRREQPTSPSTWNQDSENQNPNLATPPSRQAKSRTGAFKSISSVKKITHEKPQNEEVPRLKSTISARNLLSGRHILGHLSEFCSELKRLATRVTERADTGKESQVCGESEGKKERMPLLEVDKGKRKRKKRVEDAENIPVCLNPENVKKKEEQIRTNPPSPQCFSTRSRPMERGILQEVEQRRRSAHIEPKDEGRVVDVLWFLKPCTLAG